MTAGLEVYSSLGFKIADSNDPSLVFYAKNTVVTTNYNVLGPGFGGTLNIGRAIKPAVVGATVTVYRTTNGEPLMEQGGFIYTPSSGATVVCYAYGPAVQEADFGLEVFDESGNLTFSTSRPFFNVVGVFVDPTVTVVPSEMNESGRQYSVNTPYLQPTGKTYAYLFSNAHYWYRIIRPFGLPQASYNYMRVASMSTTGVYTTKFIPRLFWNHNDLNTRLTEIPNKEAPMRMLIVDVTGL